MHGVAWLRDAPNAETILLDADESQRQRLIQFIDSVVAMYLQSSITTRWY